nr:MAG TPA: hypothetical protein [Caudoviricetes sp.]
MNMEKVLDRVKRDIKELAKMYSTDESKIIWRGFNRYIVITKSGEEIQV